MFGDDEEDGVALTEMAHDRIREVRLVDAFGVDENFGVKRRSSFSARRWVKPQLFLR